MKLSLNAKMVLAASAWAMKGTDAIRGLDAVFAHAHPKGGAVIIATDGYRIVVVHDGAGTVSAPSSINLTPALKKAIKAAGDDAAITTDGAHAVFEGVHYPECIGSGAHFPTYRRVVKIAIDDLKTQARASAQFNLRYVADAVAMGKALGGASEPYPSIRFTSVTEDSGALIQWTGVPHAFGILMPMRASLVVGVPNWMRPVMTAAEAKITGRKPSPKRKAA
ncbi:hypothetical protein [Phenylobacterium sp.]|uniref:hypothetical protein n=1 Tax=Phenylobacterium sp. TaxID=1871053 RepID=UPI00300155C5